jgi:hypothetical protein
MLVAVPQIARNFDDTSNRQTPSNPEKLLRDQDFARL